MQTASGAAVGSGSCTGGGNAFTLYVKTHFATVKRSLPAGTPHKELMSRLAADYRRDKQPAGVTGSAAGNTADALPLPASTGGTASPPSLASPNGSPSDGLNGPRMILETATDGMLSLLERLNLAA